MGTSVGAIDDRDGTSQRQQRQQHPTRCATGTDKQDPLAWLNESQTLQIAQQTNTVRVVAQQTPVFETFQGIHRSRQRSAFCQFIRARKGFFFKRNGNIGALSSLRKKLIERRDKIVQRRQHTSIRMGNP